MNFLCDQCKQKYHVPDEKLHGRTVTRFKCKKCNHIIELRAGDEVEVGSQTIVDSAAISMASIAPSATPTATPTATAAKPANRLRAATTVGPAYGQPGAQRPAAKPAPAPTTASQEVGWYAGIHEIPVGPLSRKDLVARVVSGDVTVDTLVWREGLGDWRPLRAVGELDDLVRLANQRRGAASPLAQAAPPTTSAFDARPSVGDDEEATRVTGRDPRLAASLAAFAPRAAAQATPAPQTPAVKPATHSPPQTPAAKPAAHSPPQTPLARPPTRAAMPAAAPAPTPAARSVSQPQVAAPQMAPPEAPPPPAPVVDAPYALGTPPAPPAAPYVPPTAPYVPPAAPPAHDDLPDDLFAKPPPPASRGVLPETAPRSVTPPGWDPLSLPPPAVPGGFVMPPGASVAPPPPPPRPAAPLGLIVLMGGVLIVGVAGGVYLGGRIQTPPVPSAAPSSVVAAPTPSLAPVPSVTPRVIAETPAVVDPSSSPQAPSTQVGSRTPRTPHDRTTGNVTAAPSLSARDQRELEGLGRIGPAPVIPDAGSRVRANTPEPGQSASARGAAIVTRFREGRIIDGCWQTYLRNNPAARPVRAEVQVSVNTMGRFSSVTVRNGPDASFEQCLRNRATMTMGVGPGEAMSAQIVINLTPG